MEIDSALIYSCLSNPFEVYMSQGTRKHSDTISAPFTFPVRIMNGWFYEEQPPFLLPFLAVFYFAGSRVHGPSDKSRLEIAFGI